MSSADVYSTFLEALNCQDLALAAQVVNVQRYREDCVGFTGGFVGWEEATRSLLRVWEGLPDLHVEVHDLLESKDVVIARGTVRGTSTGRLYGAPATKRSYKASYFDYVRVEDELIVERVQQADVLGQMRQLYGKAFGLVGLGSLLWRL